MRTFVGHIKDILLFERHEAFSDGPEHGLAVMVMIFGNASDRLIIEYHLSDLAIFGPVSVFASAFDHPCLKSFVNNIESDFRCFI